MRILRYLTIWTCAASVAACVNPTGPGSHDGGKGSQSVDAGPGEPLDASYMNNPIVQPNNFCVCPGHSAGYLESTSSSTPVTWTASFAAQTLNSGDELIFDIDFAGPATWQIGLQDMAGHIGFPTTGGPTLDASNWNCIHATYEVGQSQYEVFVNQAGGHSNAMTLPMTVQGVQIQYTGMTSSAVWVDSVQVTYKAMNSSSSTVLYSQSFDNPATVEAGLSVGSGYVATPPTSIMVPIVCQL